MKKNIVLIVVDQMRFDCISFNGNDTISTPNLDMMASQGYNFTNAYTAVPSCIPSRAALLTGLKQGNHGRVGYEDGVAWDYCKTMPKTFTDLGYQTECIGKMHVYPERNRCGFEHVKLHDGYLHASRKFDKPYSSQFLNTDDYLSWFKEKKGFEYDLIDDGLDCNSWVARPWMYEEEYHPTNWLVTESIDFLRKKDPTVPFFLKMSFVRPHSPLNPPRYYFDMYMDIVDELPDTPVGDWACAEQDGFPISTIATKGVLKKRELKRAQAAYYGAITHLDHQIGRFMMALKEHRLDKNTIILFVSDHGDLLGDHNLFRKAYPYQGSIHIPMFIYDPGNIIGGQNKNINEIVEMRDIYPTLVDLAIGKTVNNIDGKSMKKLLFNEDLDWREYLHGEHSFGTESNQYILTKNFKYIWYPCIGKEQLFNIREDLKEQKDLSKDKNYRDILDKYRDILINELNEREECFVKEGKLQIIEKTKLTLDFIKQENY